MNDLEYKDLQLPWSIQSAGGEQLLTSLPKYVRTFEDFAVVDLYVGDIDPVYWAIARAHQEWGYDWAVRFSVAMLAYYHTGLACKAADEEGKAFWAYLNDVYPTAPRGTERRHFRGAGGLRTLGSMIGWAPTPESFFDNFAPTYLGIRKQCEHYLSGFGPYFQLKVCDYLMCLGKDVQDMEQLGFNLPTLPSRAVQMLYPDLSIPHGFAKTCRRVMSLGLKAQPWFNRLIGPAEVETILCDWKRAKTGSSWLGADIKDKREAMRGNGEKSEQMMSWMPPAIAKGTFVLELE